MFADYGAVFKAASVLSECTPGAVQHTAVSLDLSFSVQESQYLQLLSAQVLKVTDSVVPCFTLYILSHRNM